ncbi:hypothetical protein FA95DRAFT_368958 [Auriscalpium vulgare]|uniref:Uncharacterized protein n=1 Tax=Auriscalpium vulgare TaxID=40419 RepID=A0ACB8RI91_9AGAM|nr:hypothetical protein FA95DRAFT_368958 [Auriscalpium vulgare]
MRSRTRACIPGAYSPPATYYFSSTSAHARTKVQWLPLRLLLPEKIILKFEPRRVARAPGLCLGMFIEGSPALGRHRTCRDACIARVRRTSWAVARGGSREVVVVGIGGAARATLARMQRSKASISSPARTITNLAVAPDEDTHGPLCIETDAVARLSTSVRAFLTPCHRHRPRPSNTLSTPTYPSQTLTSSSSVPSNHRRPHSRARPVTAPHSPGLSFPESPVGPYTPSSYTQLRFAAHSHPRPTSAYHSPTNYPFCCQKPVNTQTRLQRLGYMATIASL